MPHPTAAEAQRRRQAKGTERLSAGSMLLRKLNDLQGQLQGGASQIGGFFTSFPQNVREAEEQGLNIGDVLATPFQQAPSLAQKIPGYTEAEAQGQNLWDVLSQGAGQAVGDISNFFTSFPGNVAQAEAQGQSIFDILGLPTPSMPDVGGLVSNLPAAGMIETLLGVSPAQLATSIGLTHQGVLEGVGGAAAGALDFGGEPEAVAPPEFDLQAALANLGQTEPTSAVGAGAVGAGVQPAEDTSGLNVLSSILGPAAVLPAPVQEPMPPELDLAPIRAQFLRGQPQGLPNATGDFIPTPEEDLEALQFSNVLQGIGEGGLTGASGPIGETLLRAGLGGLTGLGRGMAAREQVEAGDREQMMALKSEDRQTARTQEERRAEFETKLAGLDLELTEAKLAQQTARQAAASRNLDRQYAHALAKAQRGQAQFLGMTSAGPAMMVTKDGQQELRVVQTPPSEVDRMGAMADLMTAQAKMREAEGELSGFVDPSLAGLSMHLVQVGDELARTGGYTQAFDDEVFAAIMEDVNNKLAAKGEVIKDAEIADQRFNQALIAAIARAIQANPDLIPQLAQFSTTAAQLSMAEQLGRGGAGGQ